MKADYGALAEQSGFKCQSLSNESRVHVNHLMGNMEGKFFVLRFERKL